MKGPVTRGWGIVIALAGLMGILVPRYIFPVCEYFGKPVMKCSVMAHWDMWAGAGILFSGVLLTVLAQPWIRRILATLVLALGAGILAIPSISGYCASPRMPCNHGTLPAMRIVGGFVVVVGLLTLWNAFRRPRGARSS